MAWYLWIGILCGLVGGAVSALIPAKRYGLAASLGVTVLASIAAALAAYAIVRLWYGAPAGL